MGLWIRGTVGAVGSSPSAVKGLITFPREDQGWPCIDFAVSFVIAL